MHPSGTPSSVADPWAGRILGGRWRILRLLDDSGGMASVYLAQDVRLDRQAVVKIPKAAHQNAELRERFAREAKWHAQVSDRSVVKILDRGEEGGTPYLVLDYLPGGNLKAWCGRNPPLLDDPRRHFEAWLLPIAEALDAVAARGIVHRDVKPSNILFDAAGNGYLSDFGIVKAGDERTLTGTGLFIGTLQFMSPEQCHQDGKRSLDGRSDQYGLAVTVYQVLTGWKFPVEDDTAVVYAAKFGHSPMIEPRAHAPLVPQAVNDAVMRALSPERDKRFATNVAFAKAVLAGFAGVDAGLHRGLAAAASGVEAPSTRRRSLDVTVPGAAPFAGERSSKRLLTAAAAVVVAVTTVAWVIMRDTQPKDEVSQPDRTDVAAGDPAAEVPRHAEDPRLPPVDESPVEPTAIIDQRTVDVIGRIRAVPNGGSNEWDHSIASILIAAYDRSGSGTIDTREEVAGIPCGVLEALDQAIKAGRGDASALRTTYGFRADMEHWVGDALGFDEKVRAAADVRLVDCGL